MLAASATTLPSRSTHALIATEAAMAKAVVAVTLAGTGLPPSSAGVRTRTSSAIARISPQAAGAYGKTA